MRTMAIAATLLSFALVCSASAQQVVATNPVTGAATGAAAGAAQGAAAAGPVGALVGAPLGLAAGAVAGTLGAIGTVAGGLVGAPTYGGAPVGYMFSPGIWWSGLSVNRWGSIAQGLQMNSYGVRPQGFEATAEVVGGHEVRQVRAQLVVGGVVEALDSRLLDGAVHALDPSIIR